jgi:hypothetical protein
LEGTIMNLFSFLKGPRRAEAEAQRHEALYQSLLQKGAAENGLSPDQFEKEIAARAARAVRPEQVNPPTGEGQPTIIWSTPHLDAREQLDVAEARTLPPERREHFEACQYCRELQQLARDNPEAFRKRASELPLGAGVETPLPDLWQRRPATPPVTERPAPRQKQRRRIPDMVLAVGVFLCLGLFGMTFPDVLSSPYRAAQDFARAPSEAKELRQVVVEKETANREQTRNLVGILARSGKEASPWTWKVKAEDEGRIFLYCNDPEWLKRNTELGSAKTIPFKLNGQEALVIGHLDKSGDHVGIMVNAVKLPEVASMQAMPASKGP